jgi:hypothetical protein
MLRDDTPDPGERQWLRCGAMAVAAEALEITEVKLCKAGHPLVEGNIAWDISGKDHRRRPRCQTCKRESVRRSRERNGIVVRTMLSPRRSAGNDTYATAPLISLISKPLQRDIAAVLADDTVDQLQRNVVRRCANRRRGWASASQDMAARWLIEALLAETVDARSPLLKVEALLRLIFGP